MTIPITSVMQVQTSFHLRRVVVSEAEQIGKECVATRPVREEGCLSTRKTSRGRPVHSPVSHNTATDNRGRLLIARIEDLPQQREPQSLDSDDIPLDHLS